jgi:hypothetical protein
VWYTVGVERERKERGKKMAIDKLTGWEIPAETSEEILDTIRVCKMYLRDAKKNKDGPWAHLFPQKSVDFAHSQIEFEKGKLADL